MRCLSISGLLLLFGLPLIAQVNMDQFITYGNAIRITDECFQLTEDNYYRSGSIQYAVPIDLNKPFYMGMEVFLGCRDSLGADGIVFMFYPHAGQLGYMGEAMGFGGLAPSMGIELDTYFNEHLADPMQDHATIMFHGRMGHWNKASKPFLLPNLEDCNYHPMQITWDPGEQNLAVFLDGKQIIDFTGDLIDDVFGGKSKVYWGASAATGRKLNQQVVCFRKLVFTLNDFRKTDTGFSGSGK